MADSPAFKSKILYDYVRSVDGGHVNGIDPLILERNQLAFLRNGTVRGTFPTHRPAFVSVPLSFGDGAFQTAFETGLFQGAGYYKPDFGNESIIVSIGGRLFQITISSTTGVVSEITIAGDPNSNSLPQAWMWQAEKWMIINDGQNLPVFFDGNSSRRSVGQSAQVGTINTTFTAPAFGSTVATTFNSAFSGPFNVPIRITNPSGGASGIFQAVGTGTTFTGYPVTLKNINDTAGTVESSGSQVLVQTNIVGVTDQTVTFLKNTRYVNFVINLQAPPAFPVGTWCNIQGTPQLLTVQLVNINGVAATFQFPSPGATFSQNVTINSGTTVKAQTGSSSLVALLNSNFNAPAQGSTVSAVFDRAYTGALNQTLLINNKQYSITEVQTPSSSTQIVLLNVSFPVGSSVTGNATPANAASVDTISELPAGRMGAYGLGRVWEALTDGRSFIGGDIVGGSSGLAAYQKRDAVLKVQENDLLNGGGSFVVPGQVGDIRAMIFTSVLDASLGQGPLAVVTPNVVFSCQAPTDRTMWQNLTNPILTESMKGGGGLGQNSTVTFNSDVIMRALVGIRSYIQGRRDFDVWGNVPISREVDPTLASDPSDLLQFTSAVEFDNRFLLTTTPTQSEFGVYWSELVALNADAISSLRGKAPSVYDGIWDGLNILQLVKGSFAGVERCFAICVSSDLAKIELHEILRSSDSIIEDDNSTPIVWDYATAAVNFYENDPRKRDFLCLKDGEIRIDQLDKTLYGQPIGAAHTVTIESFFRSDQSLDWVPWHTDQVSFDPDVTAKDPGYRYAIGLGEPKADLFDEKNNIPLRHGSVFQFRFRITGHCRVVLHRFKGSTVPELDFAAPKD